MSSGRDGDGRNSQVTEWQLRLGARRPLPEVIEESCESSSTPACCLLESASRTSRNSPGRRVWPELGTQRLVVLARSAVHSSLSLRRSSPSRQSLGCKN